MRVIFFGLTFFGFCIEMISGFTKTKSNEVGVIELFVFQDLRYEAKKNPTRQRYKTSADIPGFPWTLPP
jgi:hypothetical protein